MRHTAKSKALAPPNSGQNLRTAQHSRFDNIRSQIRYVAPVTLIPRAHNPRTHSPQQLQKISASLARFGFLVPVLVDGSNNVIVGNARLEAAKQLHFSSVPIVCVEHLTPKEIKAFAIAENRTAELAGWDSKLLAIDLQELSIEDTIDITVTGFDTPEIDLIIGDASAADPLDESPEIDHVSPPISRLGDLFYIGRHRLLCADALCTSSYLALLAVSKAQMCFTDPPYNLRIEGHVSGLGRIRHREFAQASGELTQNQFIDFLSISAARITEACRDGAIIFTCMDWRHSYELLSAYIPILGQPHNHCVWVKTNGGMGSLYRSQHEFVYVFKKGTKPHINNVQLGKFGRFRTNVWNYAGANSFGKDRDASLSMHPTVKPVALIADAILDCSNRGGIILDIFAGSGSSLIAAESTGRRGFGIEIDPRYVDIVLKRFQSAYGIVGKHAATGMTLAELGAHRGVRSETTGQTAAHGDMHPKSIIIGGHQ